MHVFDPYTIDEYLCVACGLREPVDPLNIGTQAQRLKSQACPKAIKHKYDSASTPGVSVCVDCGFSYNGSPLPVYGCAGPRTSWSLGYRLVRKKCDCGAASIGVKDFEIGHSSWCSVAPL